MILRRHLRACAATAVATLIAVTLTGSAAQPGAAAPARAALNGASVAPPVPAVPSPLRLVGPGQPGGLTRLALDPQAYAALKQIDETVLTGFHLDAATRVDLIVERFHVFTDDAQILASSIDGDLPLPKPEVVLLRGAIVGRPESTVFLALSPHGSNGVIRAADATYVISSGPAGRRFPTVVYNLEALPAGAITWQPFECGTDLLGRAVRPPEGGVGGILVAPCRDAVVAVETDWEFTGDLFGGDTGASSAYAATLMGAVSEILQRDVNATLQVGFLRVWSDSDDPWNADHTIEQLYQFRDTWAATMAGVPRNGAHVLSGRELGGGVAWLPGLCQGEFAYGLSANITGFFPYPLEHNHPQNWDPMVVAHETGHNFGAPHTHDMNPPIDGCAFGDCSDAANGTIMSYCHTCDGGIANIRLEFHQRIIDKAILPYLADQAPCDLTVPGPQIDQDPADQTACAGQDVTFSVQATGQERLSYQWRHDGGVIPGANQARYSIASVSGADAGQYDVIVSTSCGSVISAAATLVVVSPGAGDLNGDGVVGIMDLLALLKAWGPCKDCPADFDGDGTVGILDLLTLLANWGPCA